MGRTCFHAGLALVCWLGYVVHGFFTDTGLWRLVERLLTRDQVYPLDADVFALCTVAGIVPIALATALAWLVTRHRPSRVPIARVRR